jgi:hypothetical protein
MRVVKLVCIGVATLIFAVQAKDTYSAFSLGFAGPMSSSAVTAKIASGTDTMLTEKSLNMGWELGWTFFKLPFAESEGALKGLAFGGKISFCRWVRDSTLKELTILGTQAIVRYYTPFKLAWFDPYVQGGLGMFIGEHGFGDLDTVPASPPPQAMNRVITLGKKNIGLSLSIGLDWDVIEVSPGLTIVLTPEKSSAWLSLCAAMKF